MAQRCPVDDAALDSKTNNPAGTSDLPRTTLGELAKYVAKTLQSRSVRVVGDPNLRVVRVVYGGHGLTQNMEALQEGDCVIVNWKKHFRVQQIPVINAVTN